MSNEQAPIKRYRGWSSAPEKIRRVVGDVDIVGTFLSSRLDWWNFELGECAKSDLSKSSHP
jgi:hypothetical protein